MDFWQTVMVLFRRWYITLPAFLVTLGAAGAAYTLIPVQYESEAVFVLTKPLAGGTQATHATSPNPLTNPLLSFDESLSLTGSVLIQQLNSPGSADALGVDPGGAVTYAVTNGSTNPELLEKGPLLFIRGTGPSPEAARDITTKVSSLASRALVDRQLALNAPTSTHIGLDVVVPPTAGQPLRGSPMRAAAAVGALAVLASLAAVYGFESLITQRRRLRKENQLATQEDDVESVAVAASALASTSSAAWR